MAGTATGFAGHGRSDASATGVACRRTMFPVDGLGSPANVGVRSWPPTLRMGGSPTESLSPAKRQPNEVGPPIVFVRRYVGAVQQEVRVVRCQTPQPELR